MSAIAIPVAGISVSTTVLTFSKLFEPPIGTVIAWAGLVLLLTMMGLFGVAAVMLVVRSLRESPQRPSERGPAGRFIPRRSDQPLPDPTPRRPNPAPSQERDSKK
jgi:hypothetical protein